MFELEQSLEKARLESAEIASQALRVSDSDTTAGNASQTSALLNFVLRGFKIELLQ